MAGSNKYRAFVENGTFYKMCSTCETVYPHTSEFFFPMKKGERGLRSVCKKCLLKYNKQYVVKRWAWNLYNNAKASTAHKKGLEISIDEKYILELWDNQRGKCYWLGIDMIPSTDTKHPFQPSLDRLDRNKGYVKGNVVLCCFSANFGRNENSEDVWKRFLMSLERNLDFSQWKK